MGDAGVMGAPAADIMTLTTAQPVTGAKTFNDQKLKFRNPADTFTGTVIHPPYTFNGNIQLGQTGEEVMIVYVDEITGNYTTKDARKNIILNNSTVPEAAIQNAINTGGDYSTIIIRDGSYPLSGAFTGFTLKYNQTIRLGRGAIVTVPNAYTGSVWKFTETVPNSHMLLTGGIFSEAGTPAKNWTCIDIYTTSNTASYHNTFRDIRIHNAAIAFNFRTDGPGWSNANLLENLWIDFCKVGIQFTHTGTYTDGQSGANANLFTNITIQSQTGATHGIKDVNGRRNIFLNCYVADFSGSQSTMTISANAKNTQLMGGTCSYWNFIDLSPTGSFIRDEFSGDVSPQRRTTMSYEDSQTGTAPGNPNSGTIRRYSKAVDSNNDGFFYKAKVNGAVVEVAV